MSRRRSNFLAPAPKSQRPRLTCTMSLLRREQDKDNIDNRGWFPGNHTGVCCLTAKKKASWSCPSADAGLLGDNTRTQVRITYARRPPPLPPPHSTGRQLSLANPTDDTAMDAHQACRSLVGCLWAMTGWEGGLPSPYPCIPTR